jgi:hypothetical protein
MVSRLKSSVITYQSDSWSSSSNAMMRAGVLSRKMSYRARAASIT